MQPAKFTIVNIGCLSINKFWGETERQRMPSATCTLLETGGERLLVDPSPEPGSLKNLLFAATGLTPEKIDMILITHFHGDHRFGLELFSGKPWLMARAGLTEWKQAVPDDKSMADCFISAEGNLPDGIGLFPSPGHTHGHTSLACATKYGTVLVTGDAVMTEDFFNADEGFHNSADFSKVKETIRKIRQAADIIIPGHGNYFINKKST